MSDDGARGQVRDRVADASRLRALDATGLLQAGPVESLDRLTGLVSRLVDVPAVLVSLVAADRQVLLSAVGLVEPLESERQTPLSYSFCKYVVADGAPLIVSDARADGRLCTSLAIPEYGVIAYAGFPLRTPDGHVLGSFCVVDVKPREWTEAELALIGDLAAAAESEIAVRIAHGEQSLSAARMQAVLDSAHDGFISMGGDGRITAWNTAAETLFGWPAAEALGRPVTELVIPERFRAAHTAGLTRIRQGGPSTLSGQRLELTAVDRTGREFPIEMTLQVGSEYGEPVFHAFLHDITERKQAQEQLERERQRLDDERTFLQALLDSLDTGVVACDSDGRLVLFNPALREIHGATEQPLTAQGWARTYALCGEDGQTPLAPEEVPLARAYAGEVVRGQHLVVRNPEVRARRFLANGRPIDTPDGRRLGAVVAMHDITDTHRSEQLRRARHAVAEVLADAGSARAAACAAVAAVAAELGWACAEYWEVDDDRRHVSRVGSWATPDRDLSAFMGAGPLSFARGRGLAGAVWERDTDVWAVDMPTDLIISGRREAAGQVGLRTAIGLPVRSAGRVLGVLAFFTDTDVPRDPDILTLLDGIATHVSRYVERRHAEDLTLALAAARRDFDRVVELVNDYLWTVEVRTDGTLQSVYASPNGTGVFGDAPPVDTDMATVLAERIHADDRAALDAFHATVSGGEAAEIEVRIVGFDEVTRWVWIRAVARRDDDRLFIDGICTNITERRHLADRREQLLTQEQQQVRRLRELDRMKDELVAVVSHELCNPIGVIRGYTEMLLDDPDLTDNQRRDAAVIDHTVSHLNHLVDDLLDLARLDAGHTTIDARPLPPTRLIRDAVTAHQPAAAAQQITLTAGIGRLRVVHGDAHRLRQVLDNLLSNAIKYTPAGGTVTVTACDTTDGLSIAIADTGIGVPAEQYPQLFTRFFRASTATSRGIKGTGLGLAVTKAIVETHGGTIDVDPAPEGGTRFTVTLPTEPGRVTRRRHS